MATKKKAAKKAVPKVKEVKQIVLTQEQYDELKDIKLDIMFIGMDLEETFSNPHLNVREVAFKTGKIQSKLDKEQERLDKLIDAIDPDPIDYWADFEGDENDN